MDVAATQADPLPPAGPLGIGALLRVEAGSRESGAGSPSDGSP